MHQSTVARIQPRVWEIIRQLDSEEALSITLLEALRNGGRH